jgi:hypothetical protein
LAKYRLILVRPKNAKNMQDPVITRPQARRACSKQVARIERSEIRGKPCRPLPGFALLNAGYRSLFALAETGRSSLCITGPIGRQYSVSDKDMK